ncbi:MAG: hypothetical protein F6K42_08465 [Leptolyngbya sp. SIO1D8]|nr:hypothetical protein [Leptolyngbya sp. SIO1D8]
MSTILVGFVIALRDAPILYVAVRWANATIRSTVFFIFGRLLIRSQC